MSDIPPVDGPAQLPAEEQATPPPGDDAPHPLRAQDVPALICKDIA